ncbi:S8 family serine peptidase [Paraburkholderia terrae]|nr:S8 family serine peptidase [Paraburkholderia terrae]
MEAALYELIAEGSPDDSVPVIIRLDNPGVIPDGVRIVSRFGNIATCRLLRGAIPSVRAHASVASMKAARSYGPAIDEAGEVFEDFQDFDVQLYPGPTDQRRPDGDLPTGKGVIVAHIDWGLDFAHPDFRFPDGTTRILALWDQSAPYDPKHPNRYGYGRIFEVGEINRALRERNPYSALGYDPARSDSGRGCHGTHTAGISCGGREAGGPVGLAPESSICFVELSTTTSQGPALLGNSVAFLEGLDFFSEVARYADRIEQESRLAGGRPVGSTRPWDEAATGSPDDLAGEGEQRQPGSLFSALTSGASLPLLNARAADYGIGARPLVVNASIGRQAGQHDGKTLTEQGIDAFLLQAPGRAICQSAGNYFERAAHASGIVRSGRQSGVRFQLMEGAKVPTEVDLWYSGMDRFAVEIQCPSAALAVVAKVNQQVKIVLADGREVGRLYHRIGDPNNGDNEVSVFLDPGAPAGEWEVSLSGQVVSDGRFHAWIERTSAPAAHRSRFHPDDVDQSTTLGTICNGFHTIAVGAYDAHQSGRPVAPFSSCGPSRDGRWKPDLVAPGVRIMAARSRPRGADVDFPLLTVLSGTSMGSPHACGTVALMFSAAGRPLAIEETRSLLLGSADAGPADADYLDRMRLGAGYLDTLAAVEAARKVGAPQLHTNREGADSEALSMQRLPELADAYDGPTHFREGTAMESANTMEGVGESYADSATSADMSVDTESAFFPSLEEEATEQDAFDSGDREALSVSEQEGLSEASSDARRFSSTQRPLFSSQSSTGLPFQVQIPLTGGPPALGLPLGGPMSPIAFSLPLSSSPPAPSTTGTSAPAAYAPSPTEDPLLATAGDTSQDSQAVEVDTMQEMMDSPGVAQELQMRLDEVKVETAVETIDSSTDERIDESALAEHYLSEQAADTTEAFVAVDAPQMSKPGLATGIEPSLAANLGNQLLDHARTVADSGAPELSPSKTLSLLLERLGLPRSGSSDIMNFPQTPSATAFFTSLSAPSRHATLANWQRFIGERIGIELIVLAHPGEQVEALLPMPGDLLFRVARGEGWGTVATVASQGFFRPEDLAKAGLRGEDFPRLQPGLYVHVIEPTLNHRSADNNFARRLADGAGRVLSDTMLARIILKNRIAADEAEAVEASGTEVGDATLRKGSVGERVKQVQQALNRVHADSVALGLPGLPSCPLTVDGNFNEKTEAAVIAFQQQVFNDPANWDGVVGPETWKQLEPQSKDVSSPKPTQPASRPFRRKTSAAEQQESAVTTSAALALTEGTDGAVLRRGARGAAVSDLQQRLNLIHAGLVLTGSTGIAACPLVADGVFGNRTYEAVLSFQHLAFPDNSREWDGVVGEHTRAALDRFAALPAPTPVPVPVPVPPAPVPVPPVTGAVEAGREVVATVPMLQSHRGTAPDLILRWNAMDQIPAAVDVVVHFHGFSSSGATMRLDVDKEGRSGLDLVDPTSGGPGRSKPTLCVLPRGNFYGGRTGNGYDFPALISPGGLNQLIEFALARFAARIGVAGVSKRRLILTAHSGGGAALMRVLAENKPDEVQVFDALYSDASPLVNWANASLQNADPTTSLRVLFIPGSGTAAQSLSVQKSLRNALPADAARARRFRVEATSVAHGEIPRRFGWLLLRNAGEDLPLGGSTPNPPTPPQPPSPQPPSPQRPSPPHPGRQAGGLTQADVDQLAAVTFANAADIETFFTRTGASTFAEWFNSNLGGHPPFVRSSTTPLRMPVSPDALRRFREFWDSLSLAYDRPRISALEFASLMCITLNETDGDFTNRAETSGRNQQGFTDAHGRHPGLAYFYDRILLHAPSQWKASYNRLSGNRTAGSLFNDEAFVRAHGQRGGAQAIAHRGDEFGGAWNSEYYPQDQFTTDEKAPETEFVRQADFYKFRGRGVIQTTGRSQYLPIAKWIQAYSGSDTTLIEKKKLWAPISAVDAATGSSNDDWDQIFNSRETLARAVGFHAGSGRTDYRIMSRDVSVLMDTPQAAADGKPVAGRQGSIFYMGHRISGNRIYAAGAYRDRVLAMLQAMVLVGLGGKSGPNVAPPAPGPAPSRPQPVPAPSGDVVRQQWDAHPRVHGWFRTFARYSELAPVYAAAGIGDAAAYLDANIVSLTFFGQRQDGHRDLVEPLRRAEQAMQSHQVNPPIFAFGCLVPRAIRGTTDRLSNHAVGRAFDLNPEGNPRITQSSDYVVIGAVVGADIKGETDPKVLSRASRAFQNGFTPQWVSAQARPDVLAALNDRHTRERLEGYARSGFCNLYVPLIEALIAGGLRWGGAYHTSKDFMHFELV